MFPLPKSSMVDKRKVNTSHGKTTEGDQDGDPKVVRVIDQILDPFPIVTNPIGGCVPFLGFTRDGLRRLKRVNIRHFGLLEIG